MTRYLTVAEVLAIHRVQVLRFGGSDGVRDLGLVEAAVYRPQTGYYDDVLAEAAAMWESLSQNHPFVDGNKRTAFAATDVFLMMNGRFITADPLGAYAFMIKLYEDNTFQYEALLEWLKVNTLSAESHSE